MHCLLAFIWSLLLLPMIRSNMALKEINIISIKWDLFKSNTTCEKENCANFYKNQEEKLSSQSCHCGVQCVHLGTCCIDSPYIDVQQPKQKPVCQSVYKGGSYFMINQCHSTDSVWANLCNEEWNGDDDFQKLVPVTSLLTSITYKNYYCFRCHEASDEFLYWTVKLESHFDGYNSSDDGSKLSDKLSLTYENYFDSWMASYDEDIASFPVTLTLVLPSEIKKVVYECIPDVISECSDKWTGKGRYKCHGYMAIKEVKRNYSYLKYKNLHCALCNFENLTDILCKEEEYTVAGFGFEDKVPFSFTYLLDINRSDGELVGKVQKCASDHLWDPYTKKCRKLSCAIPGFKVKGGKCVQE